MLLQTKAGARADSAVHNLVHGWPCRSPILGRSIEPRRLTPRSVARCRLGGLSSMRRRSMTPTTSPAGPGCRARQTRRLATTTKGSLATSDGTSGRARYRSALPGSSDSTLVQESPTADTSVQAIDDCYALNVADDAVWLYYYMAFDLVRIDHHGSMRRWSTETRGSDALVIGIDRTLFIGGYGGKLREATLWSRAEAALRESPPGSTRAPRRLHAPQAASLDAEIGSTSGMALAGIPPASTTSTRVATRSSTHHLLTQARRSTISSIGTPSHNLVIAVRSVRLGRLAPGQLGERRRPPAPDPVPRPSP
jgi:hypothetical protein